MRIPSGVTDQYIYFVAVDSTDFTTRETSLTGFTVYRSRNGGTATAYTTPTINETDDVNMPGVYELLLDEDMTLTAGNDSEEVCLHITHGSMAPVTRTFELYRVKLTAGRTLDVDADGGIPWNSDWDAEVQSEVNDGLVAYNVATTGNLPTNFGSMVISSAGIVKSEAGYQDGAVWIDTINGTTGTTSYTHGTADKPSLSWASARTIADNLDIRRFVLVGESTITLTAGTEGYEFIGSGHGTAIALGGQNISGSRFKNLDISGNDSATSPDFPAVFENCEMTGNTLNKHIFNNCLIAGTITLREGSNAYYWHNCSSKEEEPIPAVSFSGTDIDFVAQHWSGSLDIDSQTDLNDNVYLHGTGYVFIKSNCSNGDRFLRGNLTLTDSATGGTTNNFGRVDRPGINAEVLDVLNVDDFAEPGSGTPGATISLAQKIGYLYKAWRNKSELTSSGDYTLYDSTGTSAQQTTTHSDNGTTATKGQIAGP